MANAIKQRGFFWWFNESDAPAHSKETAIPGLLTVTDAGRVTLETDGQLDYERTSAPASSVLSRGITGVLDRRVVKYVLLEGIERIDFSLGSDAPQRQEFTADTCTKRDSAFPTDYEQNNFTELRIELAGFEDWLELDSINLTNLEGGADGTVRTLISYKDHHISSSVKGGVLSVESLTTGAQVLVFFGDGPSRKVKVNQFFYIIFRPEHPSDREYMEYVFTKLEELLALLIGKYHRLAWPILVRQEEFDPWLTVYFRRNAPAR